MKFLGPIFLSLFFYHFASAQEEMLKNFFLGQVEPKYVFDLSSHGTLAKIKSDRISSLNVKILKKLSKLDFVPTKGLYPKVAYPLAIYSVVTKPLYRPWVLTDSFKSLLEVVLKKLSQSGYPNVKLEVILAAADQALGELKAQGKIGGIYYGFRYGLNQIRNERFYIFLSSDAESAIESVFKGNEPLAELARTAIDDAEIERNALNPSELFELKKIKVATQIFSRNSPYANLPQGWENNRYTPETAPKINGEVPLIAYCGEQSNTMLEFAQQLESRHYLKFFNVISRIKSDGLFNNHTAVILQNRRSKALFVLDSWNSPGGQEAKVFSFKNWALKKYQNDLAANPCNLALGG